MSKRALIIGIDEYDGDPLTYCVEDAKAVRDVLELSEYGFDCTLLTDKDATTRNIKQHLESVLKEGNEISLFYFAGHGAATDFGTFLLTSDCNERIDDGMDLELLTRMIQGCAPDSAAVVVLLDCCHSGAFQVGTRPYHVALNEEDLTPYVLRFSDRRALIAACMENQLAEEDPSLNHGAFTYYLIEAMTGEASDAEGTVTVNSLYDYVSRQFETKHSQRPIYRGDLSGRIVLGTGLSTKAEKVDGVELEEIERIAAEQLQMIQTLMAKSIGNRNEWRQQAYQAVCKQTSPVVEWFNRRKLDHPELTKRKSFSEAERELYAKVRSLSHLEPGMRTEAGLVEKELGSGSFGTVWRVESEYGPRAVKVYHGYDLGIEEKTSRFRHGFSAMRRLEHPLIVRVNSLYECPLSFSMDYIDGSNFREWVGSLDEPRDVITLLMRITDTIQHAHNRGVVHRDIKPENIIMKYREHDSSWDPYLTDFDLSWFSTASIQTNDALGTVFYAAPEQLGKPGSASARSRLVDVFSMGQIMFYALMGSDPTPLDLADNVRGLQNRLRAWNVGGPAEKMVSLYSDCTQRSPDARPQSMAEVAQRLVEVSLAFQTYDQRPLTPEEFIREVVFAVVGLGDALDNHEFTSPAGQTSVSIRLVQDFCSIRFVVGRIPLVDNIPDFQRARMILNQRVEAALKPYRKVQRKSGMGGTYEMNVYVPRQPLMPEYISEVRSVIVEVLGALERG